MPQYFFKKLDGKSFALSFEYTDDMKTAREAVAAHLGVEAQGVHLVFAGKRLQDGRNFAEYCIQKESTLHVILQIRGGAEASTRWLDDPEFDYQPLFVLKTAEASPLPPLDEHQVVSVGPGIWKFPALSPLFCNRLCKELDRFLDMSQDTGVALRAAYMKIDKLLVRMLHQLQLDSAFPALFQGKRMDELTLVPKLMRYDSKAPGGNTDWPQHVDGSLVTLNVLLSDGFAGGQVVFFEDDDIDHCDTVGDGGDDQKQQQVVTVEHKTVGQALIHDGFSCVHRVSSVEGKRTTLIVKFLDTTM